MTDLPMDRAQFFEFIAFCKSKPADERYDFGNPRACALSQYADNVGNMELFVFLFDHSGNEDSLYGRVYKALNPQEWEAGAGQTFGALVKRLEAIEPPQE